MENLVSHLQMICTQWLVLSKNESCCSRVLHRVSKQSTEYTVVANEQIMHFVLTVPLTQTLSRSLGSLTFCKTRVPSQDHGEKLL